MHDPACAAKVAEHIAARYTQAATPCDCNPLGRRLAAVEAQAARWLDLPEGPSAEREALRADMVATAQAVLECTPECASRQPARPFDAMALLEERCGRYTRGAHKGQLRGWAHIEVVVEGGWQRMGPGEGNGRVAYPGTILGIAIVDFNGRAYLEVA
jgi:hypothetical protein